MNTTIEELEKEEKRLRIAEACGWQYLKQESYPSRRPKHYQYVLVGPNDEIKPLPQFMVPTVDWKKVRIIGETRIPDYLNDSNAMDNAEQCLSPHLWEKYTDELDFQLSADTGNIQYTWQLSCQQRADAFLRTVMP